MDALKRDEFYGGKTNDLESEERNEVVKRNKTYRKKNEKLVVHFRINLTAYKLEANSSKIPRYQK